MCPISKIFRKYLKVEQGEDTQADFFKHSSELVTKLNNCPTENTKYCQSSNILSCKNSLDCQNEILKKVKRSQVINYIPAV